MGDYFHIPKNYFNIQACISNTPSITKRLLTNYEKVAITNWGVINKTVKYSADP